jgi:hypothetical protein
MEPISRTVLKQTVTLFNGAQGTDGRKSRLMTVLKHVRVSQARVSESVSVAGGKAAYFWQLLIDRRNTQGLTMGGAKKPYIPPYEFRGLSAEDKSLCWTLDVGDWIYSRQGAESSVCPDFAESGMREQDFRNVYGIRVISEVPAVIDEDGTIHHWKVTLD